MLRLRQLTIGTTALASALDRGILPGRWSREGCSHEPDGGEGPNANHSEDAGMGSRAMTTGSDVGDAVYTVQAEHEASDKKGKQTRRCGLEGHSTAVSGGT